MTIMSASLVRPEWSVGVIVKTPLMPGHLLVASMASRNLMGSVPAFLRDSTAIMKPS